MITRETDYAIRSLLYLARHDGGQPQSAAVIAEEMAIPYRFARRILLRLVEERLVSSVRGKQGGLKLALQPEYISLLDIARAVDPLTVTLNICLTDPAACGRSSHCVVHDELTRMQALLTKELAAVSLADLVTRESIKAEHVPH